MGFSFNVDAETHADVLKRLLDMCQSMSDDLRASLTFCQDLTTSLSKISSLVDGGEDDRKVAHEYEGALATLKAAQTHHLAVVTLAERQKKTIRDYFVLPAKYSGAFDTLPDEILLRVIESGCLLIRPCFALLNRRFRNLVYSTPSLWTYISPALMTEAQIARHAIMSEPLQLHVDVHATWVDDRSLLQRFRLAISLDSRWHSFSFDKSSLRAFQKVTFIKPVSDLRSVRTLELPGYDYCWRFHDKEDEGVEDTILNDSRFLATFLNTWRFPKLSKLVIRENTPPPGSFTSIDTLVIDLAQPTMSNPAKVRMFLHALHSLRRLEVQMDCTSPDIREGFVWKQSDINLLNLRSFRFSAEMLDPYRTERRRKDTDYELVVLGFLSSLSMPNVEKIDLEFFATEPEPPEILFFEFDVESFFPPHRSLEKVRRLNLSIHPLPKEGSDFDLLKTLGQFQRRFSSLEVFTVYHPFGAIEKTLFTGTKHPSGPSSELFQLQTAVTDHANSTWPDDKSDLSKSLGVCGPLSEDFNLTDVKGPEIIFCSL